VPNDAYFKAIVQFFSHSRLRRNDVFLPFLQAVTNQVAHCHLVGYTSTYMIKTFRHKGLAEFFETGNARKVQAKHARRLRMILTMLNAASHARQMDAPGLRLHPLKGKPEGRWAVDVDENYRVIFRFEEGHAFEVDYGDYH
jgi:toxin HigB-1